MDYEGSFREVWGGKIQYQLTSRLALISEVTNETSTRVSLGLNWYW